jgi:hypothetical protein
MDAFPRKTAEWVSFALPVAPPVNSLHRTIVRPGARFPTMIKSERYRLWIEEAGKELGFFNISVGIPHKQRADLDAYLKATLDLLQAHLIIENDKLCQRIIIQRTLDQLMMVCVSQANQLESVNVSEKRASGALQSGQGKARRRSEA